MGTISRQTGLKGSVAVGKQRSYNEVVEHLDKHWTTNYPLTTLERITALDKEFGSPSKKLRTILVTGTNGKALTINFATKLLREEGLSVGALYSPHILTYNERFSLNDTPISNKLFTELGNEIINAAQELNLETNTRELLMMMALRHFEQNNVDVALLEVDEGGRWDPANVCSAQITAITRVTPDEVDQTKTTMNDTIKEVLEVVKPGTHVVSADQSKLNLQVMLTMVAERNGEWVMPIRKLAPLAYPFEQLHGRCAALAERIAKLYVEKFGEQETTVVTNSILTRQKGQRGRPTLEAKRQSELHPQKTVELFWREAATTLPGRFQLLDREKPTLLLDTANNLDAFRNLLLGVRLLHYQRPLKGLTLIVGSNTKNMDSNEFLKLLRYFFKKTAGQIILCPVDRTISGVEQQPTWDVEKVANDIKSMKIKAHTAANFKEAFEMAQKSVDERHGLIVIAGSAAILTEYWRHKGLKKL